MSPKITHLDLNPSCDSRGSEHNLGSFSGCWRLVFLQPYLQYPASASCHIPSADCSARWWRPPDATWVPAFDWQRRHGDPHSRHNPADHICRRWREASLIRLLGYSSRVSSFFGDRWGRGWFHGDICEWMLSFMSLCSSVRARRGNPCIMSRLKKIIKVMTPRKFCERPAEQRSKQVALTGHLGAAQVRRAQTWLSSSPRTGGGTSSLLVWIALSGGGLQVEEKPGALLLLLLELESATINPRSELHRPPTHTFLCASSTTVFLSSPLYTRAHKNTFPLTRTHASFEPGFLRDAPWRSISVIRPAEER